MNIRKKSETTTTITLEWDAVPNAVGYRFQNPSNAPKWSHTFDPSRREVKFSKPGPYKIEALGVEDSGVYTGVDPPPPTGVKTSILAESYFAPGHNPEGLTRMGAKSVRWSGCTLNPPNSPTYQEDDLAEMSSLGIKVMLLGNLGDRPNPQAAAQGARAWIDRHGPNGTNASTRNVVSFELGNETYGGWFVPQPAGAWYGQLAKAVGQALQGTGVPMLVQLSDQGDGGQIETWINDMFGAAPDLLQYVGGWTFHPYGPTASAGQRIQRALAAIAQRGDTVRPWYFTEFGIATDNGNELNDNYGWPKNMTYQQAADGLVDSYAMWAQRLGNRLREVVIYTQWDGAAPGTGSAPVSLAALEAAGAPPHVIEDRKRRLQKAAWQAKERAKKAGPQAVAAPSPALGERENFFGVYKGPDSAGYNEKGAWAAEVKRRLSA